MKVAEHARRVISRFCRTYPVSSLFIRIVVTLNETFWYPVGRASEFCFSIVVAIRRAEELRFEICSLQQLQ